MKWLDAQVEKFENARFQCHARWRCLACNSPWFASLTIEKARRRLEDHMKRGCPQ